MFGFLKKKLKETVERFSKKAVETAEVLDTLPIGTDDSVAEEVTEVDGVVKIDDVPSVKDVVKEVKPKKEKIKSPKKEKPVKKEEVKIQPEPVVEKKLDEPEIIKEPILDEKIQDVISPEKPVIIDAPQEIIQDEVKKDVPLPTQKPEKIKKSVDTPKTKHKEESVSVLSETSDLEDVKLDDDIQEELSQPKKKGFFKSLFSKKSEDEIVDEPEVLVEKDIEEDLDNTEDLAEEEILETEEKIKEDVTPEVVLETTKKAVAREDLFEADVKDSTKKKKGFFAKIKERVVKFQLTDDAFEDLFWDFELALLENNVAMEVIEKIKNDLHAKLTQENVSRKSVEEVMMDALKDSISEVLDTPPVDLIKLIKSKKPFVMCVVGVNGSGKTTTIAKLINHFKKNNLSIVVAAADTFRAAAIQQLEEHTTKLGVKLIKHDYNSDPAAVAFDAIKHATAKNIDVVLIDTAGRLQSNSNLMDELRKLVRVNKPDFNLFIGESITGNDCVEQAVAFNDAVGVDGLVLSKADIDEKGGAALSVSYVTKKPILYLGVGQTYDDLKPFDKAEVMASLGL